MDDNYQKIIDNIKTRLDCRSLVKKQGNYYQCPVCGNMMSYYNKRNLLYCPKCGKLDALNLLSLSLGFTAIPRGRNFFDVLKQGCQKIGEPYYDGRALEWDAVIERD